MRRPSKRKLLSDIGLFLFSMYNRSIMYNIRNIMSESTSYNAINIYSYIVNNSEPASVGFWLSSNNLGSYIAGILVFFSCGLITFAIKEYYKKPPSFSGVFYLKLKTIESKSHRYNNIESYFMITMINESNKKSTGRIEKIYDIELDGQKRPYYGRDRNAGDVYLSIERFYVRKNELSMHIILNGDENRAQRKSSTIIIFDSAKKVTKGKFESTAADAKGDAWMQDSKF